MNKIQKLSVDELNQIIENNIVKLNEIDNNVSNEASNSKQNEKTIANETTVLCPKTAQTFLMPYKDIKFMFFAYKNKGNVIHLLFGVNNIKKLMDGQAILSGNVILGNEQLDGDIVIDFTTNKVYYKHEGNRCKYVLEPDRRTQEIWTTLLKELQQNIKRFEILK